MSNIDQFESIFRSASKDVFESQTINLSEILLVTDLDKAGAEAFAEKLKSFFNTIDASSDFKWDLLTKDDFTTTAELLDRSGAKPYDLICTYRNLHSDAWKHPHSLGEFVDVLLQRTQSPVLLLPHPGADYAYSHAMENTDNVAAITDHLSNDHRLVNYAARFTQKNGHLYLTHIEDETAFNRYIEAISKIETIDTDVAKEKLKEQLLKEPLDYIESCREKLEGGEHPLKIEAVVQFGQHLSNYTDLIKTNKIDLLVMNTKDKDQLAMRGIAYELTVQTREIPLLLI